MATTWPRHWDKVAGTTSFSYSVLHGRVMNPDNIVENTPTVFIKFNNLGLVDNCWEGRLLKATRSESKIWIKFKLDRKIECPLQYLSFRGGWYVDEEA